MAGKDVQAYTDGDGSQPVGVNYSPEERLLKQQLVCKALAKSMGNVSKACRKAQITRATYLHWLQTDRAFLAMVEDARAKAKDYLRDKLWERGADGTPEPLVVNGKLVRDADGQPILVYKTSDRIMLALANAYLEEFQQKPADASGDGVVTVEVLLQQYFLVERQYVLPDEAEYLRSLGERIEQRKRAVTVDAN